MREHHTIEMQRDSDRGRLAARSPGSGHGSQFDVATGALLDAPATEPVKIYPVRVEGDGLQVGT
jgi:nitrite reductase/ring-hydroxylating ferredoxin subunit